MAKIAHGRSLATAAMWGARFASGLTDGGASSLSGDIFRWNASKRTIRDVGTTIRVEVRRQGSALQCRFLQMYSDYLIDRWPARRLRAGRSRTRFGRSARTLLRAAAGRIERLAVGQVHCLRQGHPADLTIWAVLEGERPKLVPYDGFHAVLEDLSGTPLHHKPHGAPSDGEL